MTWDYELHLQNLSDSDLRAEYDEIIQLISQLPLQNDSDTDSSESNFTQELETTYNSPVEMVGNIIGKVMLLL